MKLVDFGYNDSVAKHAKNYIENGLQIGRITAEHKERYIIKAEDGEYEAEITGNLRYTAQSREDFPAVGDWVAVTIYDSGPAIIYNILPRTSVIKRKAVGQLGEIQIIATNIDYAFLVQAVDRDFNINRLERYLTICNSSKVKPIVVLSKIDLIENNRLDKIIENIKARLPDISVLTLNNMSGDGFRDIKKVIEKRKTYCMLGSSGVGKSTLLNNLCGEKMMRTDSISKSTNKGRHVTSHRELIILDSGGIIIDTPGMREVGIADTADGLEMTFDQIYRFAESCRFADCTHTNEKGCAVIEAVRDGKVDKESYMNFLKMEREKSHFEASLAERRKKDKEFGKMLKNYKKDIKKIR